MPQPTILFIERKNAPTHLVCDAEAHFDHPDFGVLQGLRLVGFSIWRTSEGENFVNFPSRPFGVGGDRRYFDLLRPLTDPNPTKILKRHILSELKRQDPPFAQKSEEVS